MKDFYTLADLQKWTEPEVRLGVLGDPVAHSHSPQMMNAALEKLGSDARYARFQIGTEELESALTAMKERNFIGLNLTVPHKRAALLLMDELEHFARVVGAVNCVRIEKEKLIGFNTDGPGFARAIRQEFSVDLRDLRVLLFGAGGGAGRAIAHQCARDGCERLVLVNRDVAKSRELATELRPFFHDARVLGPVARLEAIEWNEAALRFQIANSDLLVNATALGLKYSDPSLLSSSALAPHLMVYDLVYQPARTPLLHAANEAGARAANGLSMLLHQGALSFERWFDRDAPLETMRSALA